MKKLLLICLTCTFLVACQIPHNVTRVNSDVHGMMYNKIGSTYLPKLTVVSLNEYSDKNDILSYAVENYKYEYGSYQKTMYSIPKNSADEHKKLLEKFLEWNAQASQRGDQFTKEIGRAKTYNGYSVYTFHSGNKYSNFLTVCFSLTDTPGCSLDGVTFDTDNVKLIISDINKFQSGQFKQLDTSIYN